MIPGWTQGLHDMLERQLLPGIRGERHLAYPCQQITESRVVAQVGTEDERIQEKADQIFSFRMGPVCDWRADREIILTT